VTGGSVPSDATAVSLNVTVTGTTDSGYLSLYPAGGSQPLVSNLNWTKGETVPNAVIVPVGTGGAITIYNHTGSTQVIVDLEGYFAPESGGATTGAYVPLTPARITDTRTGSGYPNAGSTLTAGGTLNVQVSGAGGVPAAANISGAILNITVTDTTAASYLTAFPTGTTMPTASNLNWTAGETVANRVLAPVSSTGQVTLYNYVGSADVIVDVDGYYSSSTETLPSNASLYDSVTPTRVIDTRVSGGTLGAGGVDTIGLYGAAGIPSDATAAVTNVTAVNTTAASFFTVYPAGVTMPTASDVNWTAGQIVPNLTVATLGTDGDIDVYNHAGSADLVIDAFGYFVPFTAPIVVVNAAHSSIVDTTGTTTVTATVTDASLTYPDPVEFSESGAACGTLNGGTTASGGSVAASGDTTPTTVTYDAGTTAGNCVITATEASGLNTGSITITQTAPTDVVTMTANQTVTGGSTSPIEITATVKTAGGVDVSGDKVAWTESGTPTASCGTLTPTTGTTGSNGEASTFYTPTTTSGFCQVTATEANTGQTGTTTITTELTAPSSALTVTVGSDPTIVDAGGTTTSTITVSTFNGGVAYGGDPVELSTTGVACGTLASSFLTTGASTGTATTTYTSGTTGSCHISATEANSDVSSPTGNNSTLTTALVSGTAYTSLTVAALVAAIPSGTTVDLYTPATSHSQQFVTSAAAVVGATTVDITSAAANAAYPATTSLLVTDGSSVIAQPNAPVPANIITVSPASYSAVAGSGDSTVVTVTVTNPTTAGPVDADSVAYATSGTCGSISPVSPLSTGTNGEAEFAYTTDGSIGFCTVTLSDGSGGSATFTATASS
jgi:hypothetical protein